MTDLLPLFPLGTVLFPGMSIPLHVFEERYRRMIADRHQADPAFGIVLLRSGRDAGGTGEEHVYPVGTAARILSRRRLAGGRYDMVVRGTRRFSIQTINWELGYGLATVRWHEEMLGDHSRLETSMHATIEAFEGYVKAVTSLTGSVFDGVRLSDDPVAASYDLASRLAVPSWERQRLLEARDAEERFAALARIVRRECRLLAAFQLIGIPLDHPGERFTLN